MAQNFISTVSIQFEYFDRQLDHPDWSGKKVLDFGGNVGNILLDPNCKIEEENYWCLDVSKNAITEGQNRYPAATFLFYDSYNLSFNPNGIPGLEIPDLGIRFDYILSYSIFSHMESEEMTNKVGQLIDLLEDDGALVFTFLDADYNGAKHFADFQDITNFEKRLMRLNDGRLDKTLIEKSKGSQNMVLINGKDLYINDEYCNHERKEDGGTLFTYYTPEYLKSIFDCEIINPPAEPYYENYPAEMQHACIIKKKNN